MKLTGNTNEMLRHYVGNRKKGHIFINQRTGKRLTLRHFENMIDKWARLLNIRKISVYQNGRQELSETVGGWISIKIGNEFKTNRNELFDV